MISDAFNDMYLVRGVDGHVYVDRNMRVLERNGEAFADANRIAQLATYVTMLSTALQPTLQSVRSMVLRFSRRTVVLVLLRDGYLAVSARPNAPPRRLRNAAVKTAKSLETDGYQPQSPAPEQRREAPAPPRSQTAKKRSRFNVWE